MFAWAVLAGAIAGGGLALLVAELAPARPDLAAALARLDPERQSEADSPGDLRRTARLERSAGRAIREACERYGLRIPVTDLDILDITPERFVLSKTAFALGGLFTPAMLTLVAAVAGIALPVVMSVGLAAALAAGGFFLPDVSVRRRGTAARRDFRRACCSYLDLIALERLADAGAIEAAERAASLGPGWAFARIRDALVRAQLAGTSPWAGLARLAHHTGVVELADIGDIVSLSGRDGASIYTTLRARARSLRTAIAAERTAEANAASERLVVPAACLGLVFLALIAYPALIRISGG